jgi:hypothetical protein
LGPEGYLRKVLEDEAKSCTFLLMGEGPDSCGGERFVKNHGLSYIFLYKKSRDSIEILDTFLDNEGIDDYKF